MTVNEINSLSAVWFRWLTRFVALLGFLVLGHAQGIGIAQAKAGEAKQTAGAALVQARQLAHKWQADAELNKVYTSAAGEEGSAGADPLLFDIAWSYHYYSPKVRKVYRVYAAPGKTWGDELYVPDYDRIHKEHRALPDDAIDSDQAMKLLRKHGFKPLHTNAMTLSYPKFFSNKKPVKAYWCVTNEKIGYGGFCVDARTGEYVGGPLKSQRP